MKICENCNETFDEGNYYFAKLCKKCYYEKKATEPPKLPKQPYYELLKDGLKGNDIIKLQRLIRNTNRIMEKFFAVNGEVERFKNWLSNEKIYTDLLEQFGRLDKFVETAVSTNIIYDHYVSVRPINNFMKIKAIIYQHYIELQEKKTYVITKK